MPTANSIITPQTPVSRTAVATAAETTFHAPTTAVDLLLAADNPGGARITRLYAVARAAIGSACNCQLYERNGAAYTLIDSVQMATGTPSGSIASQKADFGYSEDAPLIVRSGVGLAVAVGQAVSNGVAFKADGGLY